MNLLSKELEKSDESNNLKFFASLFLLVLVLVQPGNSGNNLRCGGSNPRQLIVRKLSSLLCYNYSSSHRCGDGVQGFHVQSPCFYTYFFDPEFIKPYFLGMLMKDLLHTVMD